jgi:hypothetical protein
MRRAVGSRAGRGLDEVAPPPAADPMNLDRIQEYEHYKSTFKPVAAVVKHARASSSTGGEGSSSASSPMPMAEVVPGGGGAEGSSAQLPASSGPLSPAAALSVAEAAAATAASQ